MTAAAVTAAPPRKISEPAARTSMTVPFDLPAPADLGDAGPLPRRRAIGVRIGAGKAAVIVGEPAPIIVQSMTNTDTADAEATAVQRAALARAGSVGVRTALERAEAAAAVPHMRGRRGKMDCHVP